MTIESPPTRTHWVDTRLRRQILSGALAPGTKLRAEHLAETLGVSPTPLREAFQRLVGEGLVVIEPQRGARVAPIDGDDALELYDLRILLEPLAMRASLARTDAQHAEEVADAYLRLAARSTTSVPRSRRIASSISRCWRAVRTG